MSVRWTGVRSRAMAIVAASVIATIALVALPALVGADPSSGAVGETHGAADAGGNEQDVSPPEDAVAPRQVPVGLRTFAVTDLPDGFHVDRNEFQDQPSGRTDRVYMAFVRGEDPDASADWTIVRVRVLYGPFDAKAWYDAYMKPDPNEESGEESGRIPNVELTSVGANTNALIEYPHPGQDSGIVLRFGDKDAQIMLTSTPGVTESELRQVAEGIVEVSP